MWTREEGSVMISLTALTMILAGAFIAVTGTMVRGTIQANNFEKDRSQALYKAESQLSYTFSELEEDIQTEVIDQIDIESIINWAEDRVERINTTNLLTEAETTINENDYATDEEYQEAVEEKYKELYQDEIIEINEEANYRLKREFKDKLRDFELKEEEYRSSIINQVSGSIEDFNIERSEYNNEEDSFAVTVIAGANVENRGLKRERVIERSRNYDFNLQVIDVESGQFEVQLGDNPFADRIRTGGKFTDYQTEEKIWPVYRTHTKVTDYDVDNEYENMREDKIPSFEAGELAAEAREQRFRDDFQRAETNVPGTGHFYNFDQIYGGYVPFGEAQGIDYHYYKSTEEGLKLSEEDDSWLDDTNDPEELIYKTPTDKDGRPEPRIIFVEGDLTIEADKIDFENHYFAVSGELNIKSDPFSYDGDIKFKDSYLYAGEAINFTGDIAAPGLSDANLNFTGSMMSPGDINFHNINVEEFESSDNLRYDLLPDAFTETIIESSDNSSVSGGNISFSVQDTAWGEKK
ncbi:MAG: hypothetical protein R6V17_03285 [Halanaerobacter sp.]